MRIKEVFGRVILDSRKERTVDISVRTNEGVFSSSSPSGKSKGENERPTYIKNPEEDIKELVNMKIDINFEKFSDLEQLENIIMGKIGANTLYALETAILKAMAINQSKNLWQVLNEKAKKFPFPIVNCIGGGLHTSFTNGLRPDFQEFHFIPRERKFVDNIFIAKKAFNLAKDTLKLRNALGTLNDENAFATSLSNEEVLGVTKNIKEEINNSGEKIEIGTDIAASTFFNKAGKFYEYKNPYKRISEPDQTSYIQDLIKENNIFYAEDPLHENNFLGFSNLRRGLNKPCLVAGDDLICSQTERLKEALKSSSVNAIIVKPNQVGSLIEIAKLVSLAKKNEIITIFSHRSGETMDYALADLSFAFQTEFLKLSQGQKERDIKINRMIEIEKNI